MQKVKSQSFMSDLEKGYFYLACFTLLISLGLNIIYTLDSMPLVISFLVLLVCVLGYLGTLKTYLISLVLAAMLTDVGEIGETFRVSEYITRDMVRVYGAIPTPFINLGLFNTGLLFSGYQFLKELISSRAPNFGLLVLPSLLFGFSFLQYIMYPGYFGHTITSRVVIVMLFMLFIIGYKRWRQAEVEELLGRVVAMVVMFSPFIFLRFLDSTSGRFGMMFALLAPSIVLYYMKGKSASGKMAIVFLAPAILAAFVFGTFFTKIAIMVAIFSMFIAKRWQSFRKAFIVFPIVTILVPLSSYLVDYGYDQKTVFDSTLQDRESQGIADLTQFSPDELLDILVAKFTADRTPLWQSCLDYVFVPLGINAVVPDPVGYFSFTVGPHQGFMWLRGPHHAFLWLIRVYGGVFGFGIFVFLNFILYKLFTNPIESRIYNSIIRPFSAAFAIVGFTLGDYLINSAPTLCVYVLIGLGLNMAYIGDRGVWSKSKFR
jgi:hypothetical protein